MTPADKLREAALRARDGRAFTDESFGELLAAWLDTHVEWAANVQEAIDDGVFAGPIDDRWPGLTAALALADALGVRGSTDA